MFVEERFKPVKGVAMGTKMGTSYACLFMGHMDERIFRAYPGMFLYENIYKLDAVKFSLIDSPAKKNKNIRFLCLSLRNGKTNVFFVISTLTIV